MAQSWTDSDDFVLDDEASSSGSLSSPTSSTSQQETYSDKTGSGSSSFCLVDSLLDSPESEHYSRASGQLHSGAHDDNFILYKNKDSFINETDAQDDRLSEKSDCDSVDTAKHKPGDTSLTSSMTSSSSDENMTSLKELSPSPSRRQSFVSSESPAYRSRATGLQVEDMATSGLWVFGYGSLCWHQGFDYSDTKTGFVLGFSRRFWQGNVTHRGTDNKPGRVATLVEDSEGIVWGQAFQVRGEAALPYLDNRECELGGYRTTLATFHPRDDSAPFPAVLYVATPNNRHWLGDGPLPSIADQIVESKGASGHNVEYLLRLAEFLREHIPEAADEHVFGLEALVRDRVDRQRLCLRTLMGETPAKLPAPALDPPTAPPAPSTSAQFSNRVPSKKLRCVNI